MLKSSGPGPLRGTCGWNLEYTMDIVNTYGLLIFRNIIEYSLTEAINFPFC